MSIPDLPPVLRFGDFELDVQGCELRRRGRPVKLGRQPMDVLILLVERRGQLVLRADIVDRLWGKDVFVDVETGVNTAISKIRQALRDSAETPTFVETVPARGYRFVSPVDVIARTGAGAAPAAPLVAPPLAERPPPDDVAARPTRRTAILAGLVAVVALVAIVVGVSLWTRMNGASAGRVALAVLPFDNVGNDPAREYLATGLTQETSASLAQIDPDHLSVKGRAWQYKGTVKSAVDIGRELSVDYLVESTIRSEGGLVRVTATLLRVKDQEHVWSASYDREPASVLGLEQELSRAIAEQIRGRLWPERGVTARRQTQNADAYDAYLKARYLESRRTATTNAAAIQLYERAVALDPHYALAWSSLAFTAAGSVINGDARPFDVMDRARDAAAHAVASNPNLAEAQFATAYVKWLLDWDWPAAETAFRLALRLDPSDAVTYRTLGHALSQQGHHPEAEAMMRRARELEPLEPMSYALSAQVAFQARDYQSAIDFARRAVLVDSKMWVGYSELAQAYAQTGQTDLAMAALGDAARFSGGNSMMISMRGYLLAKTGQVTAAREALRTLTDNAQTRYVPPYAMALVHAGLDERDELFGWLDKAYAERDVHLIYLPVDAKWDAYRGDPRFAALLQRCGFTAGASAGG